MSHQQQITSNSNALTIIGTTKTYQRQWYKVLTQSAVAWHTREQLHAFESLISDYDRQMELFNGIDLGNDNLSESDGECVGNGSDICRVSDSAKQLQLSPQPWKNTQTIHAQESKKITTLTDTTQQYQPKHIQQISSTLQNHILFQSLDSLYNRIKRPVVHISSMFRDEHGNISFELIDKMGIKTTLTHQEVRNQYIQELITFYQSRVRWSRNTMYGL